MQETTKKLKALLKFLGVEVEEDQWETIDQLITKELTETYVEGQKDGAGFISEVHSNEVKANG